MSNSSSPICWKDVLFSFELPLKLCQKSLAISAWAFSWTLYSDLCVSTSPIPHCLCHSSFKGSLKIKWFDPSNSTLLKVICLFYSNFFAFPYKFFNLLVQIQKKILLKFWFTILLILKIDIWGIDIFTMLSHLTYEHFVAIHFFRSSLIPFIGLYWFSAYISFILVKCVPLSFSCPIALAFCFLFQFPIVYF